MSGPRSASVHHNGWAGAWRPEEWLSSSVCLSTWAAGPHYNSGKVHPLLEATDQNCEQPLATSHQKPPFIYPFQLAPCWFPLVFFFFPSSNVFCSLWRQRPYKRWDSFIYLFPKLQGLRRKRALPNRTLKTVRALKLPSVKPLGWLGRSRMLT